MFGLTILAIVLIGGGLLWCWLVPSAEDRMYQVFWVWVVMAVGPAFYWAARLIYGPLPF